MTLRSIIEALITAAPEPISSAELLKTIRATIAQLQDGEQKEAVPIISAEEMLELASATQAKIISAIAELNNQYSSSNRAFVLLETARGWKLYTRPDFAPFARQLFPASKPQRLTAPAMETLAIIAYRQPITKASIDAVRGVASDGMLQKLLDRELIHVSGRADLPGRPLLYATTETFYEHFGLKNIDQLPNSSELRKIPLPEPKQTQVVPEEQQLSLGQNVNL